MPKRWKAEKPGAQEKQPRPKRKLSREDAADILASAIGYCRESGLAVTCENMEGAGSTPGRVVITVSKLTVSDIGVQALFTVRPPLVMEAAP